MKWQQLAGREPTVHDWQRLEFDYERPADQGAAEPIRHPVVVVGAGPVGLALAIDLAQRGVSVVVLDDDCRLSTGSRAICFAKRTLEIFDRLGCGQRMVDKGVSWHRGRVFFRERPVYDFDLLPEAGHERPAFINLQQYYVEGHLLERAAELPLIELRWKHEVVGITPDADGVRIEVETPDGKGTVAAEYVAACDGSRSAVRRLMGLESKGRSFRDRFLIADVKMQLDEQPSERWFWFDPPFHPNQSVLLHRQPDGVWRIDFQLGWDADPQAEKQPEKILPRVNALLAHTRMKDAPFELQWASVYTFACLRMERFRHGRVLFAGDAAHGVSPFGARGANSGIQDAENLAWKLALVLRGEADAALLDSYADEREAAADENIRHSTRSTEFITPKSEASRVYRDAVLDLARTQPFARAFVNSGRLSTPTTLDGSALNTPDADTDWAGRMRPGAVAIDAPLQRADGSTTWLLRELGDGFTALVALGPAGEEMADRAALQRLGDGPLPIRLLRIAPPGSAPRKGVLIDADGLLAARHDLRAGSVLLFRPDQHLCARWRRPTGEAIDAALRRALGSHPSGAPRAGVGAGSDAGQGARHEPLADPLRFAAPDDAYEALIDAHQGLDGAASQALNARLVLLLANHIGDLGVLRQALRAAREPVPGGC